jgi:protein-S-isoprenylcysteine O-methyltransferase Ste14
MWIFLIPLLLGFTFNLASAFTAAYSCRWGDRRGSIISAVLRDVLGIPVWAIGLVLAVRAQSPYLFLSTTIFQVVGWLLLAIGAIIILVALLSIRLRAAVPSTRDALIQSGLYGLVRHPIHSGTLLELAGLVLISPTLTVVVACLIGAGWVLLQTRFEEYDLLQRLPEYREYMKRVPRFFPRISHVSKIIRRVT